MKEIAGVVFDWGGVIIHEPSLELQEYCAAKLGLSVAQGSESISKYLPLYQEGRISEQQLWRKVCADWEQDTVVLPADSLWGEAVRAVFRFRGEVLNAIEQLKHNGYRVGFLSNTEPEAAAYFHELKMENLFHASILSCEVGVSKPNRRIYSLVARGMKLPLERLLMLDDRPENIEGARRAGMQAIEVSQPATIVEVLRPMLSAPRLTE